MGKQIIRWSYWLGLVCLVISLVWRVLTAFGVLAFPLMKNVSYSTIYRGAGLFFLTAIATAAHLWCEAQKP
jgi:hypothetical protein